MPQQQQELEPQLDQNRLRAVEDIFQKLRISMPKENEKGGDMKETQQAQESSVLKVPNFNSRGEMMLTNKQIKDNYSNAWIGTKWYQIPMCRRSVQSKVSFFTPFALMASFVYGLYLKKRSPIQYGSGVPIVIYLTTFFAVSVFGVVLSFADSLLFDPFCNIDSLLYQQGLTRKDIANLMRNQSKIEQKSGWF